MTKRTLTAAIALLALCAPVPAPAQAARVAHPGLPAWLEAADRGDFGPLHRGLRTTRNPAEQSIIEARLAAGRWEAVHRRPDLARIAAGSDPALARAALAIISSGAFAAGDYERAAPTSARLARMVRADGDAEAAEALERTALIANLLKDHPRQQVEGAVARASVPLRVDMVGLPRITIAVNGTDEEAVVDTGANLTVLSAETARRLGVTVLETEAAVGNSVQGIVPVRIGVADRLAIAGTIIRNVPVLVIDDAQLTFPQAGGYRITSILGLPVLRELGRIRMDAESFTVEAAQDFDPARQNLFASNNELYLSARVGGHDVPLFVDTGANQTSLGPLFADANPGLVAALETGSGRMAGAGGQQTLRTANWTGQRLEVAGRAILLPSIRIQLRGEGSGSRHVGVIGSDTLRRFASHTFDFRAMRLELGEPTPLPAPEG